MGEGGSAQMSRLEKGQSTSNIFSVSAALADVERIQEEIKRLKQSIGFDDMLNSEVDN